MRTLDQAEVLKFAELFIVNKDDIEAMKILNPHLSDDAVRVKASRWMHNPEVWQVIAELSRVNLSQNDSRAILEDLYLTIIRDPKIDLNTRLKAAGQYAQLNNLNTDTLHIKSEQISDDEKKFIDLQLERLGLKDNK